jgi:hypothetical protein
VVRQLTRPVVRVAPAILDAYTGTYDTPMGPLVVTRDGDGLAGTLGEEGAARLIPETESRFAVGGGGNTVEFFRDADGRVTHAIIRAGGQEIRAPSRGNGAGGGPNAAPGRGRAEGGGGPSGAWERPLTPVG